MSGDKRQNKGRWWRIVSIVAAAALLLCVIAVGVVQHYLNMIDRFGAEDDYTMSAEQIYQMEQEVIRQEREESIAASIEAEEWAAMNTTVAPVDETTAPTEPTTVPTEAPTEPVDQTEPTENKVYEVVNILLIGQDRRDSSSRGRSDSMILCSFDRTNKTITLTSFMRDLYVKIPGYQDNRLNTVYPIGGMKLLNDTLLENFGVEVDANIEVDFNGFEEIVDAIGGVDIEMTRAEVAHLAEYYDYHHLVPGINHLSGEEALAYSRIRYIDSDFQRTGRQRAVLNALVENIREANLVELLSLVETALPLIKTDMTDSQIVGYVLDFFPMLSDCEIISQRVPADNGFEEATIRGMAVIIADPDVTRRMLEGITK